MKNILKFSPILTMLKDDIYLHRIIEKKQFNKRGFFSSKKALFAGNVFDQIIFLNKYNRFKKIKPLKRNKHLTVIKNNNILDLSTYPSQLEENVLIEKNEFQTNKKNKYAKQNKEINFKKKRLKNEKFIQNKIARQSKFFLVNDKIENRVYLQSSILKSRVINKKLAEENTFNSEEELSTIKEALVLNTKKIKPQSDREDNRLLENRTLNVVDKYLEKNQNRNIREKGKVAKNSHFIQDKVAGNSKLFLLNDKTESRVYLKRFIKEEKSNAVRPQQKLKSSIFNSEEHEYAKKEVLVLNNKKSKPQSDREENRLLLDNKNLKVVDKYLEKNQNRNIREKGKVAKNSNFIQDKIAGNSKLFLLNDKTENRVHLKRFIKEESNGVRPKQKLKSSILNSQLINKKHVEENTFNSEEKRFAKKEALVLNNKKFKPQSDREENKLFLDNKNLKVVDKYLEKNQNRNIREKGKVAKNSNFIQDKIAGNSKLFLLNDKTENRIYLKRFIKEEELSAKKEVLLLNNKKFKPKNDRAENKLFLDNRTLNIVNRYLEKNKDRDIREKGKVVKNSNFIQDKIAGNSKLFLLNDKTENRIYLKRFIKEEEFNGVRPQRNKKFVNENAFNSEEKEFAKKEALVLNNQKFKPQNDRNDNRLLENRTLNVVDKYLEKNKNRDIREKVVKNSNFIQNKIAEKKKLFLLNDKIENRVHLQDKRTLEKNIFNSEEELSAKKEAFVLNNKKIKSSKKREDFNQDVGFNQKNLIKKENRKIKPMGKYYLTSMPSLDKMSGEKFYMNTSAYGLNANKQEDKFYLDFVTKMNGLDRKINHLENRVVNNRVIKNAMTLNESSSSVNNDFEMKLPLRQKEELGEVKYAKSDRHQNVKSKKVESASLGKKEDKHASTDDLNELSMKIFRRLKSDINLEYARLGR